MRNVTRPTRFIAFTDDPTGLEPGVEARPIPPIKLPITGLGGSPWRKLALWSRDIGLEGDILFLDLDVVVVGPLDPFFDVEPGKLAIVRDWGSKNSGNSSVMRFPAGGAPHLVDNFEKAPLEMRRLYSNEQVYLTRRVRTANRLLAAGVVPEFQSHDDASFSTQSLDASHDSAGGPHRRLHRTSATARSGNGAMACALVQEGLQDCSAGNLAERALALIRGWPESQAAARREALGLWKGN